MMSSGKLHPIYVALDGHQYNRAVKLALALPDSNTLGKALLAHAYFKSGQKHAAVTTLHKILGGFCELSHELKLCTPYVNISQVPAQKVEQKSKAKGKGKKGKKKPAQSTQREHETVVTTDNESIIDRLDKQPSVPASWTELPSSGPAITDETILATLAVTLQNLKLPLTAFQIYSWAVSLLPSEEFLTKAFTLGLGVLASPSRWDKVSQEKIETHVLSQLQVIAMQLARLVAEQGEGICSTRLATGWATQAALWQLQWLPHDEKRQLILPRLAESMALRLLRQEEGSNSSAEVKLLCHRILGLQEKSTEMLEILKKESVALSEVPVSSEFGVGLTAYQVETMKAQLLMKIGEHASAKAIYEELLAQNPDDWSCWRAHLECCAAFESAGVTSSFVETILAREEASKYPLRGPHLMRVELAAHSVRSSPDDECMQNLADAIIKYGNTFGHRASCAFSDLEPYIDQLLHSRDADDVAKALLAFSIKLQKKHMLQTDAAESMFEAAEVRSNLRAYIFAEKINQKVLAVSKESDDPLMADWAQLLALWELSITSSALDEREEAKNEMKLGDELALLAVNKLIRLNLENRGVAITCATILERAIINSPNNSYLKFAAMDIYHKLDATSLSWNIYKTLGLKHIQLDSCSFTILPYLIKGGLYNETIELCNSMLRFHTVTARDCGDYSGRAMKSGMLSKADEFIVFQRTKMNTSLSMLEAKGLILDAAPVLAEPMEKNRVENVEMLHGRLGRLQGIVGAESDYERATAMISEIHNPFAALSVVSWARSAEKGQGTGDIADNRDSSILSHRFLYSMPLDSKDTVVDGIVRRGHIHGLLLRAALLVAEIKGPKKGKVVGQSDELRRRAESFLRSLESLADIKAQPEDVGAKHLLSALMSISHAMSIVGCGSTEVQNDSLEEREVLSSAILEERVLVQLIASRESLKHAPVKTICFVLPNYVVPLFSLFRMCSKVCELFGWGKRKAKSRRCASAMAAVASQFQGLIEDFRSTMARAELSYEGAVPPQYQRLLEDDTGKQVLSKIVEARKVTMCRIDPILTFMIEYLTSFDVSGE